MKIHTVLTITGIKFSIVCPCGFETGSHYTLEGAGRAADVHMAERFPLPSSRRPCNAPVRARTSHGEVYTGI